MAEIDRVNGLVGTLGVKAPVRAATTANIALTGTQTVDGVALAVGDRVLVKDQTDATQNGLYYVESGAWTRAPDFDGARDTAKGTLILVVEGSTQADQLFRVNNSSITFGSTLISFIASAFSALALAASSGSSLVGFIQDGAGAVLRTLQSKGRDIVSVKDFGALGDGATSDTAAIQAAINYGATLGKEVFFPAGVYLISTLSLPLQHGGITLRGEAPCSAYNLFNGAYKGTVLVSSTATGHVVSCDGGAFFGNRGIKIFGINIVATTSGNLVNLVGAPEMSCLSNMTLVQKGTGGGVYSESNWSGFVMENCTLNGGEIADGVPAYTSTSSFGIAVKTAAKAGGFTIRNCIVNSFDNGIELAVGAAEDEIYEISIDGSYIQRNRTNGLVLGFCNTVRVRSHFEYNKKEAIVNSQSGGTVKGLNTRGSSFYRNGETAGLGGVLSEINISQGSAAVGLYCADLSGMWFFGLGSGVTAIYAANCVYASGKIEDNYFKEYAAVSNGIDISPASRFAVQRNIFDITGTEVADPTLIFDYPELGTVSFTPTIIGVTTPGVGTYSIQQGYYQKVRNKISFSIYLSWSAHTGTGNMRVEGLPFTSKSLTNYVASLAVRQSGVVIGAGKQLSASIGSNTTQISLFADDDAGGATAGIAIDAAGTLIVSGEYFI